MTEKEIQNTTVRLSVPIERELNNQFSSIIPGGLKAHVVRCLVELVIETQRDLGKDVFLIQHLINKQCKIVILK